MQTDPWDRGGLYKCRHHVDIRGFSAECEAFGMRINTSKSEDMVLCQKTVDWSLWEFKFSESCSWMRAVLVVTKRNSLWMRVFSVGWLGSPFKIGWGVQTSGWVAGVKDAWTTLLSLLSPQFTPSSFYLNSETILKFYHNTRQII